MPTIIKDSIACFLVQIVNGIISMFSAVMCGSCRTIATSQNLNTGMKVFITLNILLFCSWGWLFDLCTLWTSILHMAQMV